MISIIPAPLAGRVAIITGASWGIGAAVAIDFARRGCSHIAITYLGNIDAAKKVLSSINEICPDIKTALIRADVTSEMFGQDAVKAALSSLSVNHIDIVVSNAALSDMNIPQNMETHTKDASDRFMTANVWSPFQLSLAAIPYMTKGERIITISSVASKRPNVSLPLTSHFGSWCFGFKLTGVLGFMILGQPHGDLGRDKAASDSITRVLAAAYLHQTGITINSVAVGPTNTDALRTGMAKLPKEWTEALYARATAERRITEVHDVTDVVSWLAGPDSKLVNGNFVPCSGGSMLELQG
ncbi:uncharacterized protein Z519_09572 [Cladophialophora bantiana CBS 173.52]|uniref:3-oxoacyl-[acyl-carrier protein] reductase n=1 Tax=Cladophialophora bantiana (strain ATCC 10958 / CBS 173.52 / CDC B-1940 / NIH 8579) TaxID=1442370 RepID=A0A0D2HH82_CLAB1|nr:uncharacterized protein Z519_09572 [Cladophialophora bantiana CBS 173.52]KIW90140.1 hypothetical protein Z519_09572 [Cladophialophora bantiana CBS 173.52]